VAKRKGDLFSIKQSEIWVRDPGGTWVNICSVCATCLSEPRPHDNPFPILNTFGKLNAIFAIPT